MKRINSYILTGGVIILGLCGCTSNFDDYNKDPNRAEVGKANSSQMLEDLIFEGAGSMKYRTWRHNNEFMQYTVETSTLNQLHRFVLTDSEFKGAWNFCGRWAVNAIEMYKLAEKEENTNAQAIALTMKALYLSNMTDLFGDMPFKEAFKGIDENIMQPKFDVEFRLHDVFVDAFERLLEGHVAEQVGHVRKVERLHGQGYGLRVGILLLLRELIHLYGIDGPASAEIPCALEFAVGEHEAVQLIQRAGLHRILHELVVVAPRAVFHASGALENQVFEHLGGVGLADLRPVGVLVVIVEIARTAAQSQDYHSPGQYI